MYGRHFRREGRGGRREPPAKFARPGRGGCRNGRAGKGRFRDAELTGWTAKGTMAEGKWPESANRVKDHTVYDPREFRSCSQPVPDSAAVEAVHAGACVRKPH